MLEFKYEPTEDPMIDAKKKIIKKFNDFLTDSLIEGYEPFNDEGVDYALSDYSKFDIIDMVLGGEVNIIDDYLHVDNYSGSIVTYTTDEVIEIAMNNEEFMEIVNKDESLKNILTSILPSEDENDFCM
ncbi:MAG: hypothetical protein LUF02_05990 [Erysipelotrichaceae bacterium]|nr:hypothetical protein [Erysipelotrichaceae bacterium]